MSKSVVGFLILGFASLIVAFLLEGGHAGALLEKTAAMIVFGGTIAAVGVSFPFEEVKKVPKMIKIIFTKQDIDMVSHILYLRDVAFKARKEGLLSIEVDLQKAENLDPFIEKGLGLVIDGVEPSQIRNALEVQLEAMAKRHKAGAAIFEAAGGFAPTMGIIGTVMGLVHVLGNLSDPGSLGPQIAVAFIATLYGVASANLLWLPMGSLLKAKNVKEINEKVLLLEGILMIQEGANPKMMVEKLVGFLNSEEVAKLRQLENMATGGSDQSVFA